MKLDYATPSEEVRLRYVIAHRTPNLEPVLSGIFAEVALTSYGTKDIADNFQIEVTSVSRQSAGKLSLVEIRVFSMPYDSVRQFEDSVLDVDEISEICKTYDSLRLEENREFLAELYDIEMKIREIYTILARLQGVNVKNSRVRLLKDYQDREDVFKRRAMNEFFFIEFSDYKNVDTKKDAKLDDLLEALRYVKRLKDIPDIIDELSHSSLRLEERFNELARVPEAIGRLEDFRNCIAHNRFTSENDIENFEKAKGIINDVYNNFIDKLKNKQI